MKLLAANLILILSMGCGEPHQAHEKNSPENISTKRDPQGNNEVPIVPSPPQPGKQPTLTNTDPQKPSTTPGTSTNTNLPSSPSKPAGPRTLDQVAKEWKAAKGALSLILVQFDWDNFSDYVEAYQNFAQMMKDPNSEVRKSMATINTYENTFSGIIEPFNNWMIHISDGKLKSERDADMKAISAAINKHSKHAQFAGFFFSVDDIKARILSRLSKLLGLKDFSNQKEEMAKALKAMNNALLKSNNFQGTDFTDLAQEIESLDLGGVTPIERNDNLIKVIDANKKLRVLLKKFE